MPGFDQPVVSVDSSRSADGILEVRHEDGIATASMTELCIRLRVETIMCMRIAAAVSGSHSRYAHGGASWPVYEDGRPVYDGDKLQTTTVETIRYKNTPSRHTQPQKRPVDERKPPNRKKP